MEESEEEKKILDMAAEINVELRDSKEEYPFEYGRFQLTHLLYKIFCKKPSFQKKNHINPRKWE